MLIKVLIATKICLTGSSLAPGNICRLLRVNILKIFALLALLTPCPSLAIGADSQSVTEPLYTFDLPSGLLSDELITFTRQTGLQIIFTSDLTSGLKGAPLRGRYTAIEALMILLSGTNLRPHVVGDLITLTPFESSSPSAVIPSQIPEANIVRLDTLHVNDSPEISASSEDYRLYAVHILGQVRATLNNDHLLEDHNYSVRLWLWIDRDGRIIHSKLFTPSGDSRIDNEIDNRLQSAVLLPPPRSLPQPVRLKIRSDRPTE